MEQGLFLNTFVVQLKHDVCCRKSEDNMYSDLTCKVITGIGHGRNTGFEETEELGRIWRRGTG